MARYLTDLADAVRASGLPTFEQPGWRTRGHGGMSSVSGVVCHWTATPDTTRPAEDYPSLAIVRDGRTGLLGPLAQLGLGRSGSVCVIAAGLAYHAGTGYWPGIGSNGNANTIGIECEEGGDGDWTPAQLAAYPRLVAALCRHYGIPIGNVIGHNEWAPGRKPDIGTWPGGMTGFRATTQQFITNPTGGFLMALSDAEQRELLGNTRQIVNVLGPYFKARNDKYKDAPSHALGLGLFFIEEAIGEAFTESNGKSLGRLVADLHKRPAADVDEALLADELAKRGVGGTDAAAITEAVRAAFARAGQEG